MSGPYFESGATGMSRYFLIEGLDGVVHCLYRLRRVQVATRFLSAVYSCIGYSHRGRQIVRSIRKGKDPIAIRFPLAYAGISVLWKSAGIETTVEFRILFGRCYAQSR